MKDALILIHLPWQGYDEIIVGVREYAHDYLMSGKPVYQLLNCCTPCELGLEDVITVPDRPEASSAINQILDIKEMLKTDGIAEAEACGMYRYLCVEGIVTQLRKVRIDYPYNEKHEARVRQLNGYSVDVEVLEHLSIK